MTPAHILFVVAVTLLVFEVAALLGVRELRAHLHGKPGYRLTTIVYGFMAVVVAGQALSVVNATMSVVDRNGTNDVRLWVFILIESLTAAGVLWAFWRLRRDLGDEP